MAHDSRRNNGELVWATQQWQRPMCKIREIEIVMEWNHDSLLFEVNCARTNELLWVEI